MCEESGLIFGRVVRHHARGRGGLFFWGGLATLLFVGLLSGPVIAVYREFGHAWLGVFNDSIGVRWQAFPVPSAGMVLASLLLAMLPVIICAMACSVRTTSAGRVQAAMVSDLSGGKLAPASESNRMLLRL